MKETIFYGTSARHLQLAGIEIKKTEFPDGEISVFFQENVENHCVCYFQSTCGPGNDHLMELLITVNAFQQQYAGKIVLVMPYFGYSRQDRLDDHCSSISAKVVANLIGQSGIYKLVTLDLHTPQLTGFFPMPVRHLSAMPLLVDYLQYHLPKQDGILVAPDIGALKRVNELAERLSLDVAVINKRRSPSGIQSRKVIGEVAGKRCVLVDDMIDSGKTLIAAAEKLHSLGAKEVHAMATHGLFSGHAIADLEASSIKTIVVTNSVDQARLRGRPKFTVIDIRDFLQEGVLQKRVLLAEEK